MLFRRPTVDFGEYSKRAFKYLLDKIRTHTNKTQFNMLNKTNVTHKGEHYNRHVQRINAWNHCHDACIINV